MPDGQMDYVEYGRAHPGEFRRLDQVITDDLRVGNLKGICTNKMLSLLLGSSPLEGTRLLSELLVSGRTAELMVSGDLHAARESLSAVYTAAKLLGDAARLSASGTSGFDSSVGDLAMSTLLMCSQFSFWDQGQGPDKAILLPTPSALASTRACLNGLLRSRLREAEDVVRQRLADEKLLSLLSDVHKKHYRRRLRQED